MAQTGSFERIVPSGFHAADVHGWVLRVEKHVFRHPFRCREPGKQYRLAEGTHGNHAPPCCSFGMYYRDGGLLKVYICPPGSQRFANAFSGVQQETGNRAKSKVTTAENSLLVGIRESTRRLDL